ncbi:MAG: hypothetical protein U1E65_18215 [Myxococcota bacterium]
MPYEIIGERARGLRSVLYVVRGAEAPEPRLMALKRYNPELSPRDFMVIQANQGRSLFPGMGVPILDAANSGGLYQVLMPLVEGPSVAQLLTQGPLPLGVAVDIADRLLQGLGTSPGVVHGGITARKVIVRDGGALALLGMDRIGARPLELDAAAPEQVVEAAVDGRTDLFAVGALLYRMLTGAGHLPAGSPGQQRLAALEPALVFGPDSAVPARVQAILQTAMAPDPQARFRTAAEMREALSGSGASAGAELEALFARTITRSVIAEPLPRPPTESMREFYRPGETFGAWGRPTPPSTSDATPPMKQEVSLAEVPTVLAAPKAPPPAPPPVAPTAPRTNAAARWLLLPLAALVSWGAWRSGSYTPPPLTIAPVTTPASPEPARRPLAIPREETPRESAEPSPEATPEASAEPRPSSAAQRPRQSPRPSPVATGEPSPPPDPRRLIAEVLELKRQGADAAAVEHILSRLLFEAGSPAEGRAERLRPILAEIEALKRGAQ